MTAPPEPARRLAKQARWVWRLYWAGGSVAALIAGRALGDAAPDGLDTLLWALPLVSLVAGTPVLPELHWRRWRWEVREHEIDLQRGILRLRRTLIPMARVQHVETTRGVLEQGLGLATVEVHTAAGSHTIPLLTDYDAGLLRARIAELARTEDDEPPPPAANAAEAQPPPTAADAAEAQPPPPAADAAEAQPPPTAANAAEAQRPDDG